jgi:hypothetical protein
MNATHLEIILSAMGLGFSIITVIVGMVGRAVLAQVKNQTVISLDIANLAKDMVEVTRKLDAHIQWHIDHTTRR